MRRIRNKKETERQRDRERNRETERETRDTERDINQNTTSSPPFMVAHVSSIINITSTSIVIIPIAVITRVIPVVPHRSGRQGPLRSPGAGWQGTVLVKGP